MEYHKIFEPGRIGRMGLKNRIVMPAMGTNLANENGAVTKAMIDYYRERAKGGAGLIVTEIVSVDSPQGYAIANQLSLDDNSQIASHNELVEAVKEHGAKIICQLHHAGRQTSHESTRGIQPVAPSVIPDPYLGALPKELTLPEIKTLIKKFIDAAVRAQYAGYDGVEIHGAHGYLVAQFMSPASNKRTDLYGGDFNGRMRFATEIIKGVKQETGGLFPVVFRYSADEFIEEGIDLNLARKIARVLQDTGIDALNVSAGTYASMYTIIEPANFAEGWKAYLAEAIKKEVGLPVITVGSIRSPETAEGILREGKADFVALGRTLIADPEWPLKVMENRVEEIRKCISCNIGCIGERVFRNLHLRCTVNPVAGREHEFPVIPRVDAAKAYAVIGGGPAGMEAARVLAVAGNNVILFEKESELGGQVRLASIPPGKEKIRWSIDYLKKQMELLSVDVRLNTDVNAQTLQGMEFDTVILATGAAPIIPDIEGARNPNVAVAWDVLAGHYDVGHRVVVIGGGSVGCETALFLRHKGIDVEVVEMEHELASEMEPITRMSFLNELVKSGVKTFTGLKVLSIRHDGVLAIDDQWKERWLPCTHAVISMGVAPINQLENELKSQGMRVKVIGDAKEPGKLIRAITDGFLTAYRLVLRDVKPAVKHPFMVEQQYQYRENNQLLQ